MIKFFAKGFSHGDGYYCKAIGLPAGFYIDKNKVEEQLYLRRNTVGRSLRMKSETDEIVFLSGFDKFGKTDGSPLQFFIKNVDNTLFQKPPITAMRSGHADLVGCIKHNLLDARYVCELSSARRTVAYTAFGAICKQILKKYNIYTYSFVKQIGKIKCATAVDYFSDNELFSQSFRCADPDKANKMQQEIEFAQSNGDSIGGKVAVGCIGLPMGMGDFVNYEGKLDGILAQHMMSIPSVKAVEIGLGVDFASAKNSRVADKLSLKDENIVYDTNNCGGFVAGLTTNKPLNLTLTVKPVPTTKKGVPTIDIKTKKTTVSHFERSDTCVVPSVGIIAENIMAMVVLDKYLEHVNHTVSYKKFNKNDFSANSVFVVDKNLLQTCGFLPTNKNVFVVENGEQDKNFETAYKLLNFLSLQNLTKNDTLVAIGGGAVIDLSGFVASIYKRGIRLCVVPTTLLAMVDAGHGGKNAINYGGVKNLIGSFYLPEKIIIDFDFLQTNTFQNFHEGFGEIVKCALLDNNLYNTLTLNKKDIKNLIRLCADFKNRIVSMDKTDDFWRKQLNLGHTFGHAFEIYYKIAHGDAVLMGLVWETKLAYYLNLIKEDFYKKTNDFLTEFIDCQSQNQIKQNDIAEIIKLCLSDKKNEKGEIFFVFAMPYCDFCFKSLKIGQVEEFFNDVIKT